MSLLFKWEYDLMNYWLLKTEPNEFSIDDLQALGPGIEPWDGIRNYQARNIMRDDIKKGDLAFIYHSSCKLVGVAGVAKVVEEAYPDPAQFNPKSKYYDDSVNRMTYLMNKISEYELHVARFYMRRAAYVAALNRAKFVIENYSQSVHQEEALVLMVSCYEHLGIEDLRKDTERVLEANYPNTEFNAQKIIENKAEWWEFWDSLIND